MWLSTTKKRVVIVAPYQNELVLIQHPYNIEDSKTNTKFTLSKLALEALYFTPDAPNVNRVLNGYDEENNLILANYDTKDIYTSNITSKNTFSSQKFLDRLVSEFGIDPTTEHVFTLQPFMKDGIPAVNISPRIIESFEDKLDYNTMEGDSMSDTPLEQAIDDMKEEGVETLF